VLILMMILVSGVVDDILVVVVLLLLIFEVVALLLSKMLLLTTLCVLVEVFLDNLVENDDGVVVADVVANDGVRVGEMVGVDLAAEAERLPVSCPFPSPVKLLPIEGNKRRMKSEISSTIKRDFRQKIVFIVSRLRNDEGQRT